MTAPMDFSVIIPAYNEVTTIGPCLVRVAAALPETRKEMSDLAIRNLEAFFAGAPLLSVIPEMAGD